MRRAVVNKFTPGGGGRATLSSAGVRILSESTVRENRGVVNSAGRRGQSLPAVLS